MNVVNIYTYTNIKGPRRRDGFYLYLLEMETAKGPATLSKAEELKDATENQAELKALIEALKRLRKPCALSIYADSTYLAAGFDKGWVDAWQENGWKTQRGEPVANMDEWQELANLLNEHDFQFLIGQHHSYSTWMQGELDKKEKEKKLCMTDLENLDPQQKSTKQL